MQNFFFILKQSYFNITLENLSQTVKFLNEEIIIEPYKCDLEKVLKENSSYEVDFSEVKGQQHMKNLLVKVMAKALDTAEGRYALIQTARQIVPVNVKELISRYKTIKVPTLILWGREDKIVPLEVGNFLHQAISHSELAIIDQCGHMPHEEEPDKALAIVERFLKINDVENE